MSTKKEKETASEEVVVKKPTGVKKTNPAKKVAKESSPEISDAEKIAILEAELVKQKEIADQAVERGNKTFAAYNLKFVPFDAVTADYDSNPRGPVSVVKGLNREIFQESIARNGIIEPLIVQEDEEGNLHLREGFRRYYALSQAISSGITVKKPTGYESEDRNYIPVRVLSVTVSELEIARLQISSNYHEQWSDYALILKAKKLRDAGNSNEEIASALNINETQVSGYVQIAENSTTVNELKNQEEQAGYGQLTLRVTALVALARSAENMAETEEERGEMAQKILDRAKEEAEKDGKKSVTIDNIKGRAAELGDTPEARTKKVAIPPPPVPSFNHAMSMSPNPPNHPNPPTPPASSNKPKVNILEALESLNEKIIEEFGEEHDYFTVMDSTMSAIREAMQKNRDHDWIVADVIKSLQEVEKMKGNSILMEKL